MAYHRELNEFNDILRQYELNQAQAFRQRERLVQPLVDRRFGDLSFSPSVHSKPGIRSILDVFYLQCLLATIGFVLSLGLYFYLRPYVYIVLSVLFFKGSGQIANYVPILLGLKGGMSVCITVIDHFGSVERFAILEDIKWAMKSTETFMTSRFGTIVVGWAIFKLNMSNPDSPDYCHPLLYTVALFDIFLTITSHVIVIAVNTDSFWKMLAYVGIWFSKLVVRLMPISEGHAAAIEELTQRLIGFIRLYPHMMEASLRTYLIAELEEILEMLQRSEY